MTLIPRRASRQVGQQMPALCLLFHPAHLLFGRPPDMASAVDALFQWGNLDTPAPRCVCWKGYIERRVVGNGAFKARAVFYTKACQASLGQPKKIAARRRVIRTGEIWGSCRNRPSGSPTRVIVRHYKAARGLGHDAMEAMHCCHHTVRYPYLQSSGKRLPCVSCMVKCETSHGVG